MAKPRKSLGVTPLSKLWAMSPDRVYPIEEVRCGLAQVVSVLEAIPGVHSVSGLVDHGDQSGGWQVWFHIDPAHAHAWDVIRHLTFAVNGYDCANDKLAHFGPVWDIDQTFEGGSHARLVWSIW
ncbi:MAG TPA: hypothetical protein VMS17_28615, partial [Gemmataceae bacterium]|nr:hypothetical protein [Gemmataceae bacterium]